MPNLPSSYLWFDKPMSPDIAAQRFFIRLGYWPQEVVCREPAELHDEHGVSLRIDPNAPAPCCVGPVKEEQ